MKSHSCLSRIGEYEGSVDMYVRTYVPSYSEQLIAHLKSEEDQSPICKTKKIAGLSEH